MRKPRTVLTGIALGTALTLTGCSNDVFANVVAGLQDGATTTTTGLIDAFFTQRFPMNASVQTEENGNDLFVRM